MKHWCGSKIEPINKGGVLREPDGSAPPLQPASVSAFRGRVHHFLAWTQVRARVSPRHPLQWQHAVHPVPAAFPANRVLVVTPQQYAGAFLILFWNSLLSSKELKNMRSSCVSRPRHRYWFRGFYSCGWGLTRCHLSFSLRNRLRTVLASTGLHVDSFGFLLSENDCFAFVLGRCVCWT